MNPTTEHTEHTDSATTTPCSRFRNPTLRSVVWTVWAFSVPVGIGALLGENQWLGIACAAVWCATSLYLVLFPSRREDAENPNDRRRCTKSFLWASVVISVLSLLVVVIDDRAPLALNTFLGLLGCIICFFIGLPLLPSLSVFVLAQRRFLFDPGSRRASLIPIPFALFSALSWFVVFRWFGDSLSRL